MATPLDVVIDKGCEVLTLPRDQRLATRRAEVRAALTRMRVHSARARIVTIRMGKRVAPAQPLVQAAAGDVPAAHVAPVEALDAHGALTQDHATEAAGIVDVIDGDLAAEALALPSQNERGAHGAQLGE